mgnify:CR=1 FL=1
MTAKVYVDVLAVFSREGELIPTAFVWEDGRKYAIDKVSKPERYASRKAGGTGYRYKFPMEDYQYVIEVNQNAVFDWCQRAAKKFIAQDSKGKIINIASMLSFFGGYTVPAYAASKGAVAQLTKAFCNEWASKKINVNALTPGYMDTEMNTALTDPSNPRYAEITGRIPAHVWGTPEDMKGPCVFLASDASDYLNGAIIPVDGGYLVK